MSKRLAYLEKVTSGGSTDPFAWYGLALEYRSVERFDDALRVFEKLRGEHADYVPTYLMAAQMLEGMGRPADAKAWCEAGLEAARKKGDAHAASELSTLLASLE
jgi:predicted Zn-dependent protease